MQDEENEAHNHPKLKKFRQKKREVQCAVNLVQKLQHYIDLNGDAEVSSGWRGNSMAFLFIVCYLCVVALFVARCQ